jgi:transposase
MPVRAYREALILTPAQEQVVNSLRRQGRSVWNTMVIRMRTVLEDVRHGYRYSVVKRYKELLHSKGFSGPRPKSVIELRNTPEFKALPAEEQKKLEWQVVTRDRDAKADKLARWKRSLAIRYAVERAEVDYARDAIHGMSSSVFHLLTRQFEESSVRWVQYKFRAGPPHVKKSSSPVSLKVQVTKQADVWIKDGYVDLSKFHPVLKATQVALRRKPRQWPAGSVVTHIALSVTTCRVYVVFFVEAEAEAFQVNFNPVPGTIGIDPGLRTAVSYATPDGSIQGKIMPKNSLRSSKFLKRLARLQRKLDRQTRANNPDAFDEKGRAKKGCRRQTMSQGMRDTMKEIAKLSGRLSNMRTESYRLAARELLSRADVINIGVWRPKRLGGKRTKKKRNIHRRGGDVAISTLASILKDYAARSVNPKKVNPVNEHLSTRTCPDCNTIQEEKLPLHVRKWSCCSCGKVHDRDIAAARNMAKILVEPE